MQQSQRDSALASVVSLLLCSLIFIYAYRETGRPLKAVACLVIGLGYTMGFTTLVIGHLNILTITFAPDIDRPGHQFRDSFHYALRGGKRATGIRRLKQWKKR